MGQSFQQILESARGSRAPLGMKTKIIAIDGAGGAGKTTLAAKLSAALGDAPIIHQDDFASWDNPLNWWPRLIKQVLKPLSKNQTAHYARYDWGGARRLAEWREVQPCEYLILEGVSASREVFRPYLAFSVWVETPRVERLRRGLARDGEDARELWNKWMAEEDKYISREQPQERADAIVNGIN